MKVKVSEITIETLASYLRLDEPSEIEKNEIAGMKASAISFITGYTGLDKSNPHPQEDTTQALFIIVADMFDNRNLYIEGKANNINKSVERILAMHSVNLL